MLKLLYCLGVFGAVFVLLGVIVLIIEEESVEKVILKSSAVTQGSNYTASWTNTPVGEFMEAKAFSTKTPKENLSDSISIVKEKGPSDELEDANRFEDEDGSGDHDGLGVDDNGSGNCDGFGSGDGWEDDDDYFSDDDNIAKYDRWDEDDDWF